MTTRFSQRQVLFLISAVLVMATLVAYEPMRHNGFITYDDRAYITENTKVTSGFTKDSIIWAFKPDHESANWHPVTWISHMLDCEIYKLNPLGHHTTSLLIHIANSLLLFLLLRKMTGAIWPSAFAAAVFALHPLHVESVAWAAERKDVLSGLFWMLTILAYIRYAERPNIGRYMLMLLAFAMGLMSKPMVITLPFVLILLDYWPLDRYKKASMWRLAVEKIPLFVLSAVSGVITVIAQHSGGAVIQLNKIAFDYRIANMFASYIKYIGKTIWPSRLAMFYPYRYADFSEAAVMLCALLFVLISVLCIYIGRRRKYVSLGWLWYIGTLVPVIGLVQVGSQAMADRYMYIPMAGLLIIVAWAVKDLVANRPRLRIVAAVLAAVALSSAIIFTRIQVKYWENSLTLFEHTLKVTENNPIGENCYAGALSEAGRVDEAMLHLSNAVRLLPTFAEARMNLGKGFLKQKKLNEAIACFNELLQRKQDSAEVYYNWALALSMQKKYNDAIKHLVKALELDPHYPDARNRIGVALLSTGRIKEAIECFNELLQQYEDSAEVHYNLAIALSLQKKYDDAIKQLSIVLKLEPDYLGAKEIMGNSLLAAGRPKEAIQYLNALRMPVEPIKVYENLGRAYVQLGQYKPAIESWTKAVELKPDNVPVLNDLAWLLATTGDVSAQDANSAVRLAQHVCELTGYKKPELLDTLAAAYAAAGRFDDAVNTAKQGVTAAKAGNQEDLANEIQSHMKLYQAGQRYQQK